MAAARRHYTDEDRAKVKLALDMNDGNIKRTARETGVAISTVRDWKTAWEKGGVPAVIEDALPAVRDEFVETTTRVRDKALRVAEEKLDADRTTAKDAAWIAAVLTDKIRLAQGQPTSRTETSSDGQSREEIRELFAGFVSSIREAAAQRSSQISSSIEEEAIDAEWREPSDRKLELVQSVSN